MRSVEFTPKAELDDGDTGQILNQARGIVRQLRRGARGWKTVYRHR